MTPARAPLSPGVPPAADVRSAPQTFDSCLRDRAIHSQASDSASPPIQARPPFPAPWALCLFPHSRLLEKPVRGTSAPLPGLGSGPRRTARAPKWAAGTAASGSRRSRRRRRRCCNGRRRLHLLLPQRPLRRESYITRRQSLLGNVVPPGPILKGDGWRRRAGLVASPKRKPYHSSWRGREFHALGGAQAQGLGAGMSYEWSQLSRIQK